MMYKFKSKATGDLIMLGPNGDQLLRLLGRDPVQRGIIEPAHMEQARHQLQAAIEQAEAEAAAAAADGSADDDAPARRAVGLRQRLWPMLQMLERAQAADEPIVWGA